ncbi:SH3 domain-containing protein [Streptomyces enissocaesilis]|uniref:SH3b domain-containing protein n=1 Tax=Streptomyces enissocaesilis TaxID=332589 RepID=A0ABP6JG98_9ACTN
MHMPLLPRSPLPGSAPSRTPLSRTPRSRSPLSRLGLYAAAGAVAALAAAGPAFAAADPGRHPEPQAGSSPTYKGRVTAKSGLLLRDKPTRGSRVVGSRPYGAVVRIFCKTHGENVHGDSHWYLLTDGTWAWGSARYIADIGPAPRTC